MSSNIKRWLQILSAKTWSIRNEGLLWQYYRVVLAEKILKTKPVECDPNSSFELHTLTCERDLLITLWSLKSFIHFSELKPRVIIYNDGSLSAASIKTLKEHYLNCELISREDFNRDAAVFLKDRHTSLEYSQQESFYCALKLFGPMIYTRSKSFLYMDTDILFFKRPIEMLQLIEARNPFFLSDFQSAYACPSNILRDRLNVNVLEKINAGLYHMPTEQFAGELDLVESYFRKIPDPQRKLADVNRHEQSLVATLLSKANAKRLSASHQISKTPTTDRTICHHYVSDGSRLNFYKKGARRLLSTSLMQPSA